MNEIEMGILARKKLGEERDRFGKREIELMRDLAAAREKLEAAEKYSKFWQETSKGLVIELEKYKSIAEILASLLKCAMTGEQSPTWFQHSVLSIEKYRALTTPDSNKGKGND